MRAWLRVWIKTQFDNFANRVATVFARKSDIPTKTVVSSSPAVTVPNTYALDAREKNAAIEGTLANMIGQVNSNLSNLNYNNTFSRNRDIDISDCNNAPYGFCFAGVNTQNIPIQNQRFLILTFTNSNGYYKKQIAIPDIENSIYMRHFDLAFESWSDWKV